MKKTITIIIILIVIVIGAYIIFSNSSSNTNTTENTQTTSTGPVSDQNATIDTQTTTTVTQPTVPKITVTPIPKEVSVDIRNFAFSPSTLTIKAGTKVTWTNNDSVSHTVTSDSGSLLDSPVLSPGESFSFTFNSAGSLSYHCKIHPMMKASVAVSN